MSIVTIVIVPRYECSLGGRRGLSSFAAWNMSQENAGIRGCDGSYPRDLLESQQRP